MATYNTENLFSGGIATRPKVSSRIQVYGSDASALVDGSLFAWDTINCAPTLDFIGGRECFALTNSGSLATDGAQAQVPAGCIQPQAGKQVRIKFAFRMTATDQEFSFGLAAIDTSIIASEPTDHFALQKVTGVTSPVIRARKSSGTAQATNALAITFAVDTWYDAELILTRDVSTAGMGKVECYISSGVSGGGVLAPLYNGTFASQIPDTVDLAPYFAWRAGSAANVSGYVAYYGVEVEA